VAATRLKALFTDGSTQRARLRVAFSTHALRRCQLTAAVARIVDMATLVAVSTYLFSRSGAGSVAVFGVVRTLVPAVGTPLVTAAAGGRAPGRALAACAAVAAGGSALTGLVIAADGPLVTVYVIAGLAGIALSCLRPLVTAMLPGLISRPTELVATNAAAAFIDGVSTIAGPALAGAALVFLGPSAALWAAAALLGLTSVLVATLSQVSEQGLAPSKDARGLVRNVLDGITILVGSGPIRLVAVLSVAQTCVRGALNVLAVVLAIESLDMGPEGVGLLFGAIGMGGLVGLPLAVRLARPGRMGRAMALALVLWGTPIAAAAYAPAPAVAVALFALIGTGNAIIDIASDTLLQRLVHTGALTRVLGAFDAMLYAGMALGAVIAERLLRIFGLTVGLIVTGLALPVLAAVAWRSLHAIDARLRDRNADVELLQLHGVFSPLVMTTVDHLAQCMAREFYATGETIIRKGDQGDRFILIEEGTVDILDGGELLAVLGPGDGFGEMSLLDDRPRNATAVARSPVEARSLVRTDFLAAVTGHPRARDAAMTLVRDRIRSRIERTRMVEDDEAGS
jgi:MFS family permease